VAVPYHLRLLKSLSIIIGSYYNIYAVINELNAAHQGVKKEKVFVENAA
jgi:hypothetical protein